MEEKYYKNKIYYRKNKFHKSKPTIVLIHGLSGSSSVWIPYEKKFNKKYNTLSIDLRGHGKSFRPKKFSEYKIKKFSEDIYKIIKKEKLHKFILLSHSMGSLIALDFLKKHKKTVKATIFVSPSYCPSKRILARVLNIPLKILDYLMLTSFKRRGKHIDYRKYLGGGDWNIPRMFTDITNTGLKPFLDSTENVFKFDAESFLPKINIPTLIIHGDKDTIFPLKSSKIMSKKIKKSKLIIIKGADHIIPINYFSRLSLETEKFIRKIY